MKALSTFLEKHNLWVLVLAGLLSLLAALKLPLAYDDDVVRFLPEGHEEVQRFTKVMERFGSLSVGLVGVESPDLFTPERLNFVRDLGLALKTIPEVQAVTSFTEIAVLKGDSEAHRALVPRPVPETSAELGPVRDFVLSLDYIAGALVSADGSSGRLVLQLASEVDGKIVTPKQAAEAVKRAAAKVSLPDRQTRLHFAGAPFIAEAAANGSQEDLAQLAPYIVIIILTLILLTLGSIRAGLLTVVTVGLGILWTMGLMGWLGMPLTLISTSLPVVLVALGSAYAVHLLVWYRDHGSDVQDMLEEVGWPVLVAGLTTVAGFISFLVMDLSPMRDFGWQMALGTAFCALVALTVLPAFLLRWPIPVATPSRTSQRIDEGLARLAIFSRAHWVVVLLAGTAFASFFALQLPHIETRMDTASFFEEGSAPQQADEFMAARFGGSVFLQVMIRGDITQPDVLQHMAAFEDRIEAVRGVTRVESIARVISVVEESMKGRRRIPARQDTVRYYGELAEMEDPAVRLLVDKDWEGALIQVAIGGFDTEVVRRVTRDIRALAEQHLPGAYVRAMPGGPHWEAALQDAVQRVALLLKGKLSNDVIKDGLTSRKKVDDKALKTALYKALQQEIVEDEMVLLADGQGIDLLVTDVMRAMEGGVLAVETWLKMLTPRVDKEELADRAAFERAARSVHGRLVKESESLTSSAADRGALDMLLAASTNPTTTRRIQAIADDLRQGRAVLSVAPSADLPVSVSSLVSGYPIVQEAMNTSVRRNQENSLLVSLPLVLLILCLLFRNVIAGLIGLVPTGLTLMVTFGLMGLFGRDLPLDIGASMLASIALGVGIDYAIHFLWRYRKKGLADAMRTTGRAIAINALEITAGFIVLAWASIVPMARFGILTAQTLFVAALATLVLLPALLRAWRPPAAIAAEADETLSITPMKSTTEDKA